MESVVPRLSALLPIMLLSLAFPRHAALERVLGHADWAGGAVPLRESVGPKTQLNGASQELRDGGKFNDDKVQLR